jgi:hypothetical protein
MNKILLPNLFFEEELQSIATAGSPQARRLVAELGPVMGLLAAEETGRSIVVVDADAQPDDIPPALQRVEFLSRVETAASVFNEYSSAWNVVPWGWSESAVAILLKTCGQKSIDGWPGLEDAGPKPRDFIRSTQSSPGHPFNTPNIDVVRMINSRHFQSQFDAAVAIDGTDRIDAFGTLCHSLSQVETAIEVAAQFSLRGWVIKADLSHASRNRLLGNSTELRCEHLTWLEGRFANGECVYVEPWIERVAECGLQFQIRQSAPTSNIEFIGAAEMLTDDAGRYRGSVVRSDQTPDSPLNMVWQPAIEHCRYIATVAAAEGYFGPIGFDCMIFRHSQQNRHWLRVSHDINGRMTMGRVALSLKRLLEPGETGIWLHTAENSLQQSWKESDDIPQGDVRIERTSPRLIGGKPAKTATAFVVSGNSELLQAACTRILGQTVKMPTLGR